MPAPVAHPSEALALLDMGMTAAEVAREIGCTRQTVYRLLAKAREDQLFRRFLPTSLTPHFPPGPLTPATKCNHPPFSPGDGRVCVICHQTGWDWHRGSQAKPLPKDGRRYAPRDNGLKGGADDKPKPKREYQASVLTGMTRKERRRLERASREAERCREIVKGFKMKRIV